MKVFTVILGIRLPQLLRLVFRHGIGIMPIYLIRFLVLLQGAVFSSVFSLVETIKFSKKIKHTEIEKPPVFIIGHWRTGSTWLHQMMNMHPGFTTPTMVQTSIPDHFLFSTRYYVPILKSAMPPSRPMDNVALGPFEPQEEEFALLRMGAESPIEKLLFPRKGAYFLSNYNYVPEGRALDRWKNKLLLFYKKITLQTGLQIISKNPYHSMRIKLLAEMFPKAKFIHITRDPMAVVPSTRHMWNIVAAENKLRGGWTSPDLSEIAEVLKSFVIRVREEGALLDAGHYAEISFEALEKNPLKELKILFATLDLPFSEEYESLLKSYLGARQNYQKNSYALSDEDRSCIEEVFQEKSASKAKQS